jgi:hypothetical protein
MYKFMSKLILALGISLGFFAISHTASALTNVNLELQGYSCFAIPGQTATPTYSEYGISTNSTSGMDVICPVTVPTQGYTSGYLELVGYNRNSTSTYCNLYATDSTGANLTYGTASLTADQQMYQVQSTTINPSSTASAFFVGCHISGYNSTNGNSWVTYLSLVFGY